MLTNTQMELWDKALEHIQEELTSIVKETDDGRYMYSLTSLYRIKRTVRLLIEIVGGEA